MFFPRKNSWDSVVITVTGPSSGRAIGDEEGREAQYQEKYV